MLALLYDVHGNLPALDAVLADAEAAGAERFLLGGDYALFGAWPAETVTRLRGLDARWIRGNVDRWTASPGDAPEAAGPAIERCRELLGDALVGELAALPESLADGDVLYCHASPASDVKSFLPEPAAVDEALMAGAAPRRLVFGHTHLGFRREGPGGVELVNPGSVGMPLDGDQRAAYALVDGQGGLEHRRVAYDHGASARAAREVLGSAGETPARRIEQARFDVD
ncbi:MAG TPA: metallophosphoesterase family protein [Thermoleophilaceae bacterium]|nr:metallophosphoesterase family protein [Thermoleophilaceae bacterium]